MGVVEGRCDGFPVGTEEERPEGFPVSVLVGKLVEGATEGRASDGATDGAGVDMDVGLPSGTLTSTGGIYEESPVGCFGEASVGLGKASNGAAVGFLEGDSVAVKEASAVGSSVEEPVLAK